MLEHRPDFIVTVLAAGDLMRPTQPNLFSNEGEGEEAQQPADWTAELEEAHHCDLLIVEDLQHLNPGAAELLVQTIDYLAARNRPMVLTANAGPQRLRHRGDRFPIRLVNRLAGGLVIGLDPLGPASRLKLMQMLAQRRQLAVPTEVLRWLSERLNGGGRQLEGAIAQLQTLAKLHRGPLDIATVAGQFQQQTDAGRVTVERIAERVGGYFRVALSQLQSQGRSRNVVLPRQVVMYLARQLTPLSLEDIGDYLGGRDHSTVLHACRKVELALDTDTALSGAIREIHAGLA